MKIQNKNKNFLRRILIVLLFGGMVFNLMRWAVSHVEKSECRYWENNLSEVRADWQREQCAHYKIHLQSN